MQRQAPFWISTHVTVWLRLSESCTSYQSPKGSSTSCACWLTTRSWDTRQDTYQTFLHQLSNFWVDLHYVPHQSSRGNLVVPWTCGRIGDRAFSVAASRAWNRLPTELKLLRSTWTENISVRFCLRASGYGLTLWCALGLLVGGTIQVHQLQLQLQLQLVEITMNRCTRQ